MKISLFIPCYVDQMSPHIGIAMVEVLKRLGHEIDYPDEQTCCGQPAFNMGYTDQARSVAQHFLKTFADCETIVVPSGSCAAMVRVFYSELFADTEQQTEAADLGERVFEFGELLVNRLGITNVGAKLNGVATYHDGCHGLRELGIKEAPRKLLAEVDGLKLIEMDEAESCCGFGGTFSVKFPQISTSMAEVKHKSIQKTEADYLVSADPSCMMQLQGYLERNQTRPVKCMHLAEVLAAR